MKKLTKITLGLIAILVFACSADSYENADIGNINAPYEEKEEAGGEYAKLTTAPDDGSSEEDPLEMDRKLVKTGDISFETESVDATRQKIAAALKETGGFIASENEYNQTYQRRVTLTLRVPAGNFDKLVELVLAGVERPESKNIRVEDVTRRYMDLSSRLETQKEIRDRYRQLLEKARTVNEILEVERELGNIQMEIEAKESQLKVLKNQVSLGTLEVSVWEGKTVKKGWGNRFGKGLERGWNGFVWFLVGIVNLWPLWILGFGIYMLIRTLVRRARRRRRGE